MRPLPSVKVLACGYCADLRFRSLDLEGRALTLLREGAVDTAHEVSSLSEDR